MKTIMRVAGIRSVNGHILCESLVNADAWGVPGGKLEEGESLAQGCLREYREETGLVMQCQHLAIVHEHFWQDRHTAIREYGFYFVVEPREKGITAPLPVTSLEGHMEFAWFPLERLGTVDFVPSVIRDVLPQLSSETIFLSSQE